MVPKPWLCETLMWLICHVRIMKKFVQKRSIASKISIHNICLISKPPMTELKCSII